MPGDSSSWELEIRRLVSGPASATPPPLPSWLESFLKRSFYDGGCPISHHHAPNHNTSAFCVQCGVALCRDAAEPHKPHGVISVQRLSGDHVVAATELAAFCNIQGIRRTYRSGQDVVLVYPILRWPENPPISRRRNPLPVPNRCICNTELDEDGVSRGYIYCSLMCKVETMEMPGYMKRCRLPELLAGLRYCSFRSSPVLEWIDRVPWGRMCRGDQEPPEQRRWMSSLLTKVGGGIDPGMAPTSRVFCTGCDRLGCKSSRLGHDKLPLRKLGSQYGISVSRCEAVRMNIDGIQRVLIQKEDCVLVNGDHCDRCILPSSSCVCEARLRNVDQGIVFCSIACKKNCLDDPRMRRRAMFPELYKLVVDECLSGDLKEPGSSTAMVVKNGEIKRGLDFDLNMEPEVESMLSFLELPDHLSSALAVQECMDESTREKIAAAEKESAKRKRAPVAEVIPEPGEKPWYTRQLEYTLAKYAREEAEKILSSSQEAPMKVPTPPRSETITPPLAAAAAAPAGDDHAAGGDDDRAPGDDDPKGCSGAASSELRIVAERMMREELENEQRRSSAAAASSKQLQQAVPPPVIMRKKRSSLPVSRRQVSQF